MQTALTYLFRLVDVLIPGKILNEINHHVYLTEVNGWNDSVLD